MTIASHLLWMKHPSRWFYLLLATALVAGCTKESTNTPKGLPIAPMVETEVANQGGGSSPTGTASPSSEGGWESSGGDGVACFATEAEANAARAELTKGGFLKPHTRAKVGLVVTLDSFENLVDKANDPFVKRGLIATSIHRYMDGEFMMKDSELAAASDSNEVYDRVFRQLTLNVPLFADRLGEIAKRFPLSEWEASMKVPQVNDSKPRRNLPRACVLVQIANRYTRSHDGKIPEIKIVYDQELYKKMPPFEQAILRMHEYLYALAKEGGHEDSNFIRRLNAYFFADNEELKKPSALHAILTRSALDIPFGDYMKFFLKENEFKPAHAPANSQGSRYNALIAMMFALRAEMTKCLKQGTERSACQDQVMLSENDAKKDFDGEQSLLFMARFHLDQLAKEHNSEMLTAANLKIPETTPDAIARQLADSCRRLSDQPSMMFRDVQEKALLYCQTKLNQPVAPLNARPIIRKIECSPSHDPGPGSVFYAEGVKGNFESSLVTELTDVSAMRTVLEADFELLESGPVIEQFDFDYGTKTFTAPQVYRFSLQYADHAQIFARTLKLYPHLLKNLRITVFEGDQQSDLTLRGQEALNFVITPRSDSKPYTLPRDITLTFPSCTVLDTNLPYDLYSSELLGYWAWKTKAPPLKFH